MQRYCTELTERLLKSLDKEYNVVDMGAVVDVITALEKTTITKEVLEITRLGKYINELRRKTNNDALAKRAKDLVRRWRDMVLPSANTTPQPTPADTAPQALNGTKPQSPALRGLKPDSPAIRSLKPHSPALKAFKPHSPLLRDATPTKQQVLSPASSLHSEHSRSPNPTPTKHHHHHHHHHHQHHHQKPPLSYPAPTTTTTASTTNHRPITDVSPKPVLASTQNHTIEAVPRTHSSNKRLRKEDSSPAGSPPTPPSTTFKLQTNNTLVSRLEPSVKRQRLNGEQTSPSTTRLTETSANSNAATGRGTSNNSSRPSTLNQQVPSPRESDRPIDRLTEPRSIGAGRDVAGETLATAPSGPKKRGRKKGSKSIKNQTLPEDRVKEKLASISRNPKLKTTQELLADLQARGSNTTALGTGSTTTIASAHGLTGRGNEPPSTEEILRSSVGNDDRPLSSRYLRTSREKTSSLRAGSGREGAGTNFGDSPKSRTKAVAVAGVTGKRWESTRKSDDCEDSQLECADADGITRTRELTVEEILAKLPPLDREAISWSDCEEVPEEEDTAVEPNARDITDDDVDRLHGQCVEGLNGNFQAKMKITSGDENDETRATDDRVNEEKLDDVRALDGWSIADLKRKGVYRRLGGDEDDREFREWHEMLARPSYDGQILHILPYVIVD